LRGEPEVVAADQRQRAALEPDHRADERVHHHEERELRRVRPQAEANGCRDHAVEAASPARFAATIAAWSAGGGGTSTSSARTNSSALACWSARLWRRSKPMLETGLAERERPHTEPP